MTALNIPNVEKAAIVLCSLSPYAAETVLGMLNPERTPRLRQLMETYRANPKLPELSEAVVAEFSSLRAQVDLVGSQYGFVAQVADKKKALESALEGGQAEDEQEEEEDDPKNKGKKKKKKKKGVVGAPEDDPSEVMQTIDPANLARVLQNEHPRAVAIALNKMHSRQASEVIKKLEPQVRTVDPKSWTRK